jgi:hypothetical protein
MFWNKKAGHNINRSNQCIKRLQKFTSVILPELQRSRCVQEFRMFFFPFGNTRV